MKPILLSLLALALAPAAVAAPAKPALEVTDGWSRPAIAGGNGVGYLTIVNRGGRADSLVGAETPVAARVTLHSMSMDGGVMRMGEVKAAPVPAGGKTVFGPGGYHLMLMGLKKPLNIGDHVPLTLTFASGKRVTAALSVGVMPPAM